MNPELCSVLRANFEAAFLDLFGSIDDFVFDCNPLSLD